jgi:predicted alpha/beta-fold hydrolase
VKTIESFRPPRWARGAHAQTIAGYLLRPASGVTRRRERIETPDGDFVDLDWFEVDGSHPVISTIGNRTAAAPLVLMLHGLEGSTLSTYMAVLARELAARGIECAGLNFRSCSGEPNRLPRFYHSGEHGDVVHVLELLRARAPARPLGLVGFSLGGNVALRWLGEAGERARRLVRAAAVVSVPYDLAAGSRYSDDGPGRVYARRLIQELRRKILLKRDLLRSCIDVERALRATTFFSFDDAATAPLHGFRDAADYYAQCSSAPWLARVALPTLLVHALDDPFLPAAALPLAAMHANSCLTVAVSEQGGHNGFVEGVPWAPRFFAERRVADHLAAELLRDGEAAAGAES